MYSIYSPNIIDIGVVHLAMFPQEREQCEREERLRRQRKEREEREAEELEREEREEHKRGERENESREARAAPEAVQYQIEQEYERQRIFQNEQTEREKREANEAWQESLKHKAEHENFQREFFLKPVTESFQPTTVEYGNIDKHSIITTVALCFVPPDTVVEEFTWIKDSASDNLDGLIMYFEDT
ncbi:unnamed protein product, partial [Didymodactylos carnosus]